VGAERSDEPLTLRRGRSEAVVERNRGRAVGEKQVVVGRWSEIAGQTRRDPPAPAFPRRRARGSSLRSAPLLPAELRSRMTSLSRAPPSPVAFNSAPAEPAASPCRRQSPATPLRRRIGESPRVRPDATRIQRRRRDRCVELCRRHLARRPWLALRDVESKVHLRPIEAHRHIRRRARRRRIYRIHHRLGKGRTHRPRRASRDVIDLRIETNAGAECDAG
jgi:hypothetical protein